MSVAVVMDNRDIVGNRKLWVQLLKNGLICEYFLLIYFFILSVAFYSILILSLTLQPYIW